MLNPNINKTYIKVACSGGFILITELQLSGKKRVDIEDFLRGFKNVENYKINN